MGISIRQYLFPEDGSLRRVSQRITEGLVFGHDALPEFAGTRQRVVQVILETTDRRPTRIQLGFQAVPEGTKSSRRLPANAFAITKDIVRTRSCTRGAYRA